jgi:hypothetical protein
MAVRANCQRDKSTSVSVGRVNMDGLLKKKHFHWKLAMVHCATLCGTKSPFAPFSKGGWGDLGSGFMGSQHGLVESRSGKRAFLLAKNLKTAFI